MKTNISFYNIFIALAVVIGIFTSATELADTQNVSTWGYGVSIVTALVLLLNVYLNARKTSFFYPLFAEKVTVKSIGLRLLRANEHLLKPLLIVVLTIFLFVISSSPLLIAILVIEFLVFYFLFEAIKTHDFDAKEDALVYTATTFLIHFLATTIIANFALNEHITLIVAVIMYILVSTLTLSNLVDFNIKQLVVQIKQYRIWSVGLGVFYVLNYIGFLLLLDPNTILIGMNSVIHIILFYIVSLDIKNNSIDLNKFIQYGVFYTSFLLLVLIA